MDSSTIRTLAFLLFILIIVVGQLIDAQETIPFSDPQAQNLLKWVRAMSSPGNLPELWPDNQTKCSEITKQQDNICGCWKGITCTYDLFTGKTFISEINLKHANNLGGSHLPEAHFLPPKLQTINFASKGFGGMLPASWSELQDLQDIDIGYNYFAEESHFPPSWGSLRKVYNLACSQSNLGGILPPEYVMMGNESPLVATSILAVQNRLRGKLPVEWCGTPSEGDDDDDHHNRTDVIPPRKLWQLDLGENQLESEIPNCYGRMTMLVLFKIADNMLSGPLPPSFGALPLLKVIDLRNNRLSGELPDSWGNLSVANVIILSSNFLTGRIPASWAKINNIESPAVWSRLQWLADWLKKWIPAVRKFSLGEVFGETRILLGNNRLSNGSSLAFLSEIANLTQVDISFNNFNTVQSFGQSRKNLSKLEHLDVSFNSIQNETLPEWWGKYSALKILNADGNKFVSHIPASYKNLNRSILVFSVQGSCVSDHKHKVLATFRNAVRLDATPSCDAGVDEGGSRLTPVKFAPELTPTGSFAAENPICSSSLLDAISSAKCCQGANRIINLMIEARAAYSENKKRVIFQVIPNSGLWGNDCRCPEVYVLSSFYVNCAFGWIRPIVFATNFDSASQQQQQQHGGGGGSSSSSSNKELLHAPTWNNTMIVLPRMPANAYSLDLSQFTKLHGIDYAVRFEYKINAASPELIDHDYAGTIDVVGTFTATPCSATGTVAVPFTSACTQCPQYGLCNGTSVVVTNESVWRPRSDLLPFFPCPRSNGCSSAPPPMNTNDNESSSSSSSSSRVGFECDTGYTAQFCAACEKHYTQSGFSCIKCKDVAVIITIASIAIVAVLVLATAAVYLALNPTTDEIAWYDKYIVLGRTLLNHLSVVGVLSNTGAAASLGSAARGVLHLQNSANSLGSLGSVNSLSCLHFDVSILSLFDLQWIAFSIVVAVEVLAFGIIHRRVAVIFTVVLCLYQLFFASIATSSAKILSCNSVSFYSESDYLLYGGSGSGSGSGGRDTPPNITITYQSWYPAEKCNPDYQARAGMSLALFCFVGPVAAVVLRNILFKSHEETVRTVFAFLTLDYKESAFYWEFLVMARKLFSALAIFAPPQDSLQLGLFQVVCAFSLLLTQRVLPFENNASNDLELLTLISSVVVAQMLQVAHVAGSPTSAADDGDDAVIIACGAVIAVTQIMTLLAIVVVCLRWSKNPQQSTMVINNSDNNNDSQSLSSKLELETGLINGNNNSSRHSHHEYQPHHEVTKEDSRRLFHPHHSSVTITSSSSRTLMSDNNDDDNEDDGAAQKTNNRNNSKLVVVKLKRELDRVKEQSVREVDQINRERQRALEELNAANDQKEALTKKSEALEKAIAELKAKQEHDEDEKAP